MRTHLIIGLILVTFCAAFFAPAMAQQQKDPMMKKAPMMHKKAMAKTDVPTAVMNSFKKSYPDASITATWQEKRGEMTVFNVKTMQGQKPMTMVYSKDGSLIETKEPIEMTALPANIAKSVTSTYPKGTMERAEKITRGQALEYGVMLRQGGEAYSLVYSPEGKVISTQKMMKPEVKHSMVKPAEH